MKLVAVVGSTATGKSALGLHLADESLHRLLVERRREPDHNVVVAMLDEGQERAHWLNSQSVPIRDVCERRPSAFNQH